MKEGTAWWMLFDKCFSITRSTETKVQGGYWMKPPSDDMILTFQKSSTGLKRAKRAGWVIPPFNIPENSRGPFPMKLVQIKSDFALETQMEYRITGEGADQDPKGIFTVDRLSGDLYVTQPLDREKKASYRITAHAAALSASSTAEKPMEIVIHVIDQNDNKPVFIQNPFNAHVREDAGRAGTVLRFDHQVVQVLSEIIRYKDTK
ncbi:cadherin-4-like [Labeo rohita]|uniref:cadherin-4-like n=1 Tax=Labeo rohita TaxID=84645 RepID=UPI0021E27689|nr:cadherin-4-like [Labeo rohita]